MSLENIITGMFIGAAMSIPFGPIGAVCLNRILRRGKAAGLASGLGVALGDSFFAAIVVLGITQLSDIFLHYQYYLEFGAGLVILLGGIRSYLEEQTETPADDNGGLSLLKDASSMFFITIANPQTIIGFSMALAGAVRFYTLQTTQDSLLLLAGIFSGSILWWIILSFTLEALRPKLTHSLTHKMHRIAAIIVVLLGIALIIHAIHGGVLHGLKSGV